MGPLPSARGLAEFEGFMPGLAERIVRITESQTVDVSAREDRLVDAEIATGKAGQGWAIFLSVICILAAIVFFAMGNNIAGGALLGMPLVMLIGSFIPKRQTK